MMTTQQQSLSKRVMESFADEAAGEPQFKILLTF
jgi:hypothetical protein